MADILGVILAGGQARRMGGGDKCLLDLGGRSLLQQVADRLAPQVADMVLNANGDPARFAAAVPDLPVIADSFAGFAGPLAGVLAGMEEARRRGIAQIVTVAADTPFFPADLVTGLRAAAVSADTDLALAATETAEGRLHWHPTFGLWPAAAAEDLRAALTGGTRKVLDWTDSRGAAVAVFECRGFDPFFNVNRPGDLERARAIAGAGA